MKFVKMHGCGNSYIYMDVRGKHLSNEYLGALSEKVADKNKGIGSDGLIVLDDSKTSDGRMRMYNADGSEGAMCGNGIRCLAKLMYERAGIRKEELSIETKSGIKIVKVVLENGVVTGATVDMGSPDFEASHIPVLTETGILGTARGAGEVTSAGKKDGKKTDANHTKSERKHFIDLDDESPIILPDDDEILAKAETELTELSIHLEGLSGEEKNETGSAKGKAEAEAEFVNQPILIKNGDGDIEDFTITCVSMGNPHAVTFVDEIHRSDFAVIGPEFENNAIFPDRINTEFVKKIDRGHVKMRVWERGSGETMACGTGACATVAAGVKTGRLDTRVEVEMTGGTLSLFYDTDTNHIYMTGEAVEICEGELFF
ncbi:MAG: diaminopimelate epimerase [Lachnospiraceae bacterium]|nr:diaminopimelate epimerase [Lachnospiraceae bacterium]